MSTLVEESGTALLVLEDGTIYTGGAWGATGRTLGEIVFATGMTGYQETLTDPSYDRQIVVQTAPHIGNTGVNDEDPESSKIWVAGYVVREPARRASNWRSQRDLETELINQHIVGIRDVDTRAITRHIRSFGAMRAGIFSGGALPAGGTVTDQTRDALVAIVREQPRMSGASLAGEVTTPQAYTVDAVGEKKARIVAVDLGIKARTPEQLSQRGAEVVVVPLGTDFAHLMQYHPDGVFFSNGPGDPSTQTREIELLRAVLDARIPFFGICFGHQLFGRALGFGTYKLEFGHRGINQPVKDLTTGRVEITAHNHGFAVDAPRESSVVAPFNHGQYGQVRVSHIDLNDNVVEGLQAEDIPAFSVQFHPEAAAGPHDGEHLFDRFIAMAAQARADKENQ